MAEIQVGDRLEGPDGHTYTVMALDRDTGRGVIRRIVTVRTEHLLRLDQVGPRNAYRPIPPQAAPDASMA